MVCLGRALITSPNVMLLDAPSIGLSPKFVSIIYNKVVELNKMGVTFLIAEQNVRKVLEVAHFAYVLNLGNNAFEGTPSQLAESKDISRLYLGA